MWVFDKTLLEIVLRATIVYIVVLIGIRLTGKREVGQMTPFDLVLLLLISNAVQNAMTGPDTSISGGLVAAGTLLVINVILSRFEWRFKNFRSLVEGTPTLMISNGEIIKANVSKERVTEEEVLQALHEHGIEKISDVSLAILEVDKRIPLNSLCMLQRKS